MKQTFLNSGTYTYKPLKGKLDLEKYILSVLEKDTCCTKTLFADSATITTLTTTTSTFTTATVTNLVTGSIAERVAAGGVSIDGLLIKDGGATANSMYASFYPTAASQALSGAGAVNVTSFLTKFTSTGAAQALTIASGTQIGQRKKVYHVVDGGSGVLTGVFVGGTTITFTSVGEIAELMWTGAAWAVLELTNTTAAGAVPVLA